MGLFQSVPKDVIYHHIVPNLLSFRDRLHLAMTCKVFLQEMQTNDPLTKYILTKDYKEPIILILQMTKDQCFDYFIDYVSCVPGNVDLDYMNTVLTVTTHVKTLRFIRNHLLHYNDDKKEFDEECAKRLFCLFGEDIPNEYFKFLSNRDNVCAAFARLGNFNLYKRFYDLYYAEGVGEDEYVHLNNIAFEAGMGGNPEICKHIFDNHGAEFGERLYQGIAWSGNPNTLEFLDPEDRDIMTCFKECMKYTTDKDEDFCSIPVLNNTCKYLMANYPNIWENLKKNKKIKL